MKPLKIKAPEGYQFNRVNEDGDLELIEKPVEVVSVMDRIKTVDDSLEDNGHIYNEKRVRREWESLGLSQKEIAFRLLKMLAKSLNEGWEPDYENENENKYYPRFKVKKGDIFMLWGTYFDCTIKVTPIAFKSSELAEYAGTQFIDLYKQFLL